MKQRLWAVLVSVGFILAFAGSALGQASVTTDQSDYPLGSTVNIAEAPVSKPGETIQLQVLRILRNVAVRKPRATPEVTETVKSL